MRDFLYNLFDLFVPNECLLCHTQMKRGEKGICISCQARLPRTRCDKPDNEAEHRVFGRVPYQHGTSFCYYRSGGDFANLIKMAKYRDKPWVNSYLANLFAAELSDTGWPFDIDMIVPVPVHRLRRLIRGYNQAEPIAEELSKVWHLPIERNNLIKSRFTFSQVSRSAKKRLEAMEGTFSLRHPERFVGKHVLLVDDVLTTGATLDACSQILTEAGARISFLTLGLSD